MLKFISRQWKLIMLHESYVEEWTGVFYTTWMWAKIVHSSESRLSALYCLPCFTNVVKKSSTTNDIFSLSCMMDVKMLCTAKNSVSMLRKLHSRWSMLNRKECTMVVDVKQSTNEKGLSLCFKKTHCFCYSSRFSFNRI